MRPQTHTDTHIHTWTKEDAYRGWCPFPDCVYSAMPVLGGDKASSECGHTWTGGLIVRSALRVHDVPVHSV